MVKVFAGSVSPDSVGAEFDDARLIADAGLVLVATLSRRLGIKQMVDKMVHLGERAGAAHPGRKVLTLIQAIAAGADSIDDTDMLRAGGTQALLAHRAMAPSTLGTFLRAFTFGHVRQLDRVLGEAIKRAWPVGPGPGAKRLVIDIDSFLGEAKGRLKQPPSATPPSAATTPCSPPGRAPARCCTPERAKARPTRGAARFASAKS
jgi:hypothetical protein